jgi:hypothetical protein
MALKLIVDTLDGMPEDVAKEYVEKEGKFHLDTISVDGLAVEDVSALKGALEKERKAARDLSAKVKSFEGLDPEAARDALKRIEELGDDAEIQKKIEAGMKSREAQLLKKHEQELKTASDRSGHLERQLKEILVDAAVTEALAAAGGRAKLLLPHVRTQVRMRETEDGRFLAEVVDEDGNPRVGDGQGSPMTIPQLVEELKGSSDFQAAFDGTGNTGTGKEGGGRDAGGSGGKSEHEDAGFEILE